MQKAVRFFFFFLAWESIFGCFFGLHCAPLFGYVGTIFNEDSRCRTSGISIGWNLSVPIFGILTAIITNFTSKKINVPAVSYYLIPVAMYACYWILFAPAFIEKAHKNKILISIL